MGTNKIDPNNPFGMPQYVEGESKLERALENLMETPDGRTFVWEVLAHTRIYDEGFKGNSTDTYEKGKRSVGLWLLDELNNLDPTYYPRMLLEVAKLAKAEEKRIAEIQEKQR